MQLGAVHSVKDKTPVGWEFVAKLNSDRRNQILAAASKLQPVVASPPVKVK